MAWMTARVILPVAVLCALAAADALGAQGAPMEWRQASEGGPLWTMRAGHATAVFNGRLWVLGGISGVNSSAGPGGFYQNDVWSSADCVNWVRHDPPEGAPMWAGRHWHTVAVFDPDGGGERLWVMGGRRHDGSGVHYLNDVWSSADGAHWVEETSAAGWSPRRAHTAAAFDGRLWVMGGFSQHAQGGYKNDVWSSVDGVEWIEETPDADWGRRERQASAVFASRLWVIGGWETGGAGFQNDVWSSADGVNWVRHDTPEDEPLWPGRDTHTASVFDGKLWVIGGRSPAGLFADVWSSIDGTHWVEETPDAGWPPREFHAAAVFDPGGGERMWVLGGQLPPQLRSSPSLL